MGRPVVTERAYAFIILLFAVLACGMTVGFAVGRFTARARGRRAGETGSDAALAMALESGLATLKAQRQLMSERAEASERLNSQIVANLTAGLLLVDDEGRVELLNPAACRFFGIVGDVAGVNVATALAMAPELVQLIGDCRRSHEPVVRRTVSIAGSPTPLHLGVTISLVDEGERSGAVICLFADLTSIVEMEDQLRLKDALARLGELTAGLAHEFRNGLATIHGYARLLDPALLPERYQPYVASLRAETEQLGRVVTNFLNFARPEALSFSCTSLRDVATRAADDIGRDFGSGLSVRIVGDFADVEGDEQLLKQAFDNLLRNAVEACRGADVAPVITVRGEVDRAHSACRVLVEDNGPGIPDAQRAKVFQPFFTTRTAGTGLGLAIVQKIVLAHNGKIAVASASAGHGARFELVFPLRTAPRHSGLASSAA